MRKMLLITGMPRSGTSMAACLAEGLGIPMAAAGDLAVPNPEFKDRYPQGNMEDVKFRSIVWSILDGMTDYENADEYNLALRHFTRREVTVFNTRQQNDLEKWAEKRFENGVVMSGVKLPSMSFLMIPFVHFLREIDIEPYVLFVHRSVEEAACSLAKKRGNKYARECPYEWANAVQHYNEWHVTRAENAVHALGDVPVKSFTFTALVNNTHECARMLASFCDVEYTENAGKNIDRSLHIV